VPDYGSCFKRTGSWAGFEFFTFVAAYTQYLGTSQVVLFHTETLEPLFDNRGARGEIWKEVGGPTIETPVDVAALWNQGRCAMAQTAYSSYQSPHSDAVTGFALMPGSRRVCWREGRNVVECNVSFCRHAKLYPDGTVVNHVLYSRSTVGGAINGHVDEEVQLAAFTFLSWLMNDANQIEAVINPLNSLGLSIVRPSLLVPSLWKEHGWQDPAVSLFSAISTANAEHPNVALDLRLPNAIAYWSVIADTVTSYWLRTGDFHDLTVEEGARRAAAEIQLQMQGITDLGDLDVAIENYPKMLGIYVEPTDEARVRAVTEIPNWAVWASGILVGILCVIFASLDLVWLTVTHLHRRRLRAKDVERMMCIIDEAKAAVSYLHVYLRCRGA